jgi:hypothetical protein
MSASHVRRRALHTSCAFEGLFDTPLIFESTFGQACRPRYTSGRRIWMRLEHLEACGIFIGVGWELVFACGMLFLLCCLCIFGLEIFTDVCEIENTIEIENRKSSAAQSVRILVIPRHSSPTECVSRMSQPCALRAVAILPTHVRWWSGSCLATSMMLHYIFLTAAWLGLHSNCSSVSY